MSVTPERWQQVKAVLADLADCDAQASATLLQELRAKDTALCDEVETYLVHAPSDSFLEPLAHGSDLAAGTRLGPYAIDSLLGAGAMGQVYEATDTRLERRVAVKVLPAHLVADPDRLRCFDREARIAAALNHPNIVTILDVGTQDAHSYLVMERVEGRDLKEVLDEGALPLETALDYASQVARGLVKAHAAGIVHRDLKPANLMVTTDGFVKVLDFGLATLRSATGAKLDATPTDTPAKKPTEPGPQTVAGSTETGPALSHAGQILGTPLYMSPEQAKGWPLDHRTDLWSLGAVLYEMIAGRPPFRRAATADVLHHIVHEPVEPLSQPDGAVPEAIVRIVERALAKDTQHRYPTADAMLADLEHPSGVHSVGTGRFSEVAAQPATGLRARLSSFIGRDAETEAVRSALRESRFVTLTGPGGTGKTSLAIEAVRELGGAYPHGMHFVDLAPIPDPDRVPRAIAETLGLTIKRDVPVVDQLTTYLTDRQTLLVLDNFEQVLGAASTVTHLLEQCAQLSTLVTSRAPLRVTGERELSVHPLAVPEVGQRSVEQIGQAEAVMLFVQRTRTHDPGFSLTPDNAEAVAEICVKLDGLPLAIELAAARTRVLSPQAMVARLESRFELLRGGPRDRPERHQTLRAAIQWSYDLLEPAAQTLLRQLSVCVDGCTLEAAEHITSRLGTDPGDVFDGVAVLLDNNLLRREDQADGEPRLRMLETVRSFGLEQLATTGQEAELREAHGQVFLSLAEQAAPHLSGSDQVRWQDRLAADQENLRSALDWFEVAADGVEPGLRMTIALARRWVVRAPPNEGLERFDRVLARAVAAEHRELKANALMEAATLAQNMGDNAAAFRMLEESLAIWRDLKDTARIASSLIRLGWIYQRVGKYDRMRTLTEEGLALHRELGNDAEVARALQSLGVVAYFSGEYEPARRFLQEQIELRRAAGDVRGLAFAQLLLGQSMHRQGESAAGLTLLEQTEAPMRELGDHHVLGASLVWRAEIVSDLGEYDAAHDLLEESWRQLTMVKGLTWRPLLTRGTLFHRQGNFERAGEDLESGLGEVRGLGDRVGTADVLEAIGRLERQRGNTVRARDAFRESRDQPRGADQTGHPGLPRGHGWPDDRRRAGRARRPVDGGGRCGPAGGRCRGAAGGPQDLRPRRGRHGRVTRHRGVRVCLERGLGHGYCPGRCQ